MSLDVNISEPDEFNCFELHECIKSVAKIYKIDKFSYHVDLVCGKGENYIANVFRVTIDETNKDNSVSVIVKTLINTVRQELFRELHKREVNAYKQVIDKFVSLQNILPDNERTIVPKCIFASTGKNNEVIVLEDLLLRGFVIESKFSKCENLEYSDVCSILSELAKFHALSFVFQCQDENNFKCMSNEFRDLIFQDKFLNKTKLRNYFQDSYLMSLNLIKDIEAKKKLEKVKEKLIEILRMFTEAKKFNVFCHGDCWINNILFKDDDEEKQLCFLDFQAMRYASPVTDIMYFLYLSTDSTFRTNHFEDLKLVYYNTLQSFLRKFDIDVSNIYPVEEFHKEINEMLPYGLLIALVELRVVTTTHEDEVNSYGSELNLNIEDVRKRDSDGVKLYEMRVNDVVNDSVTNGVLDRLLNLVKTL